jgi:Tol biopolymer transport system component
MNAEGHPATRRLTNNSLDSDGPVWSPDGTLIAFSGREPGAFMEIYVMSADGSNLRQLTHDHVQDMHPSWSPDGTRILYTTTRDSLDQKNPTVWGTYTIRLDGSGQTSIFKPEGVNTYASLSSDGSQLLFRIKTDGGRNSQILVMNVDGTNVRNLTNLPVYDRYPLWSPDGKTIVFESNRAGHSQLYLMNADGSNVRLLVDGPGNFSAPRFSPDGKRIIYPREIKGEIQIFTVEVY